MDQKSMMMNSLMTSLQGSGASKGCKEMLSYEKEAALHAIKTGLYSCFRSNKTREDCFRIGPRSKCFCGHTFDEHNTKTPLVKCLKCKCKGFSYIHVRPEEIGEYWLSNRPKFDIKKWFPKCKCKHSPFVHTSVTKKCKMKGCSCYLFRSDFACVVCNSFWEDHTNVFETEKERRIQKRPVREAFIPFEEMKNVQRVVFGKKKPVKYLKKEKKK